MSNKEILSKEKDSSSSDRTKSANRIFVIAAIVSYVVIAILFLVYIALIAAIVYSIYYLIFIQKIPFIYVVTGFLIFLIPDKWLK